MYRYAVLLIKHTLVFIISLDILSTIHVDTDLEAEQTETSVHASLLLVQGLRHNGDISKTAEDRATAKFQVGREIISHIYY